MDKKLLRQEFLLKRNNTSFCSKKYFLASHKIYNAIKNILNKSKFTSKSSLNIGVYYPVKGEPDLLKLLTYSNSQHYGLPKIYESEMKMVHYTQGQTLLMGKYHGIHEPESDDELIPDIICAPSLAYSIDGYRLGFGRGYYDKYLSKRESASKILKLGVCFDEFLLHKLPIEKHDVRFDYIITEKRRIKL